MYIKLIYVHGISERKPVYDQNLESILHHARNHLNNDALVMYPGYWGDLGGSLRLDGVSIPGNGLTRSIQAEEPSAGDLEGQLWAGLYEDPMFEAQLLLEAMGEQQNPDPFAREKQSPQGQKILADFEALARQRPASLSALLASSGLEVAFPKAVAWVARQPSIRALAEKVDETSEGAFAGVLARATLAQMLLEAEALVLGKTARDDLVVEIRRALVAETRGLLGDAWSGLKGATLRLLMRSFARGLGWWLRPRRGEVTAGVVPGIGDILVYQSRGQVIRQRVAQALQAALEAEPAGPLVVLCHSLGGIVLVDLMIEHPELARRVELLVTVGSQSPFFYEVNALQNLEFVEGEADRRLPAHFPRWVNVFDPSDLLSYQAETVFGKTRVRDLEVRSGEPFPWSHGAYWGLPEMWQGLVGHLP